MPQITESTFAVELSKMIKAKRWVGGIVKISPEKGKDYPYTFFELDTTDPVLHNFVLNQYRLFCINVVFQRVGKGYHYFGDMTHIETWRKWYKDLKPLNPDFPTLTLRVTRKSGKEVWERPIYMESVHIAANPPNWARALMHFLNKEQSYTNSTDIHTAMKHCGLPKYFKCVVYDVEVSS